MIVRPIVYVSGTFPVDNLYNQAIAAVEIGKYSSVYIFDTLFEFDPENYPSLLDTNTIGMFMRDGRQFGLIPAGDSYIGTPVFPVHTSASNILNLGNNLNKRILKDVWWHSWGGWEPPRWGSDGDLYPDDAKPMLVRVQREFGGGKHYWRMAVTKTVPEIDPLTLRVGLLEPPDEDGNYNALKHSINNTESLFQDVDGTPMVVPPAWLHTTEKEDLHFGIFSSTTLSSVIVTWRVPEDADTDSAIVWSAPTETQFSKGRRQAGTA